MGTINVTLPSDGETADVADVNTPITTIVNEINGNLDNSNIASGAAIDPTKLASSGFLGAWDSWTPTYTGITVGNGTVSARYKQIGKTVHVSFNFVLGSTSSVSGVIMTLPVARLTGNVTNSENLLGVGYCADSSAGGNDKVGYVRFEDDTTIRVLISNGDGVGSISSTSPFTWATGDSLQFTFTYEAA